MTQHKPPQAMSLFELLARNWAVDSAVHQVLFNAAGTSLAAVLSDGRMAFVSLKDSEHPETRIRIEADTGRSSIRPRTQPLPLPITSDDPVACGNVLACKLGDQGFAFANVDTGAVWRATARGQTLAMNAAAKDKVTALAALPKSKGFAIAHGARLVQAGEDGGAEICSTTLSHIATRIGVSGDGKVLGCWGAGQISIVAADTLEVEKTIACDGDVIDLTWSPCKRWIVAGCREKAVLLVDVLSGVSDQIVDFPSSVHSVAFSNKALITSGAFRVAGWTLPDLPFGDHEGAPIETGKPGLTLVDRIAVHPTRDLCAVGYPTGLVMICSIGHPDEMLLREGTGSAVNALAWSGDGEHLAIGGEDGSLAVATFPKHMFK